MISSTDRYRGMTLDARGRTLSPFAGTPEWENATRRAKEQALEDGTLRDAQGRTLYGEERQQVVDRLLALADMPPIFDPSSEEAQTRPYIPGIWNHDTVPAFIGPKGWGKTLLFCRELAPALIIPGRRFLGHFGPAEMSESERARDVWLINSETRPGAVHDELVAAGLVYTYRDGVPCYVSQELGLEAGVLIVEHLMMIGGATMFDLTDPAKRRWWEARLVALASRHAPRTVIADGVTAMVGNDTGRYGGFASAFHSMLHEAGIPSGLGVLHSPMDPRVNTAMQGIESIGQWDGMWIASATAFPIYPTTSRKFQTLPRMGDPAVPEGKIVLTDDGRLNLVVGDTKPAVTAESEEVVRRRLLLDRLAEADDWVLTAVLCGTGEEYSANAKVLKAMEAAGEVTSRPWSEGRARGKQWRRAAD